MGTVYATKRRNESWAAVKVLHPRFVHDKSIRARFLEEGYLANRVGHPAVVTILEDDIDEEGNFYIVMELLDGVDLGKFVGPPRTPISTAQALNIASQLLAALEKAHQKGIVHRDIKPANVMILRDGRIKLLDFGIAKALSADGTVSATEDDEDGAIGTDRYMSPEQGNGFFEDIDARSDLWSLGALLMAILADEDPSAIPLWDQSYEDRAWTFSRLGQDVPPHVVQIISLALQPQKNKRWVSASAMKEAVEAAHIDLYGPISREELSVLARTQLKSAAEELNPDPTVPAEEAPVVIEPTYPSRPSHATLTPLPPSTQRPAIEAAPESSDPVPSSAPGVVPLSRPGGLRNVAFGVLLFVLGAAAAFGFARMNSGPPEEPPHQGAGLESPAPAASGPDESSKGNDSSATSTRTPKPSAETGTDLLAPGPSEHGQSKTSPPNASSATKRSTSAQSRRESSQGTTSPARAEGRSTPASPPRSDEKRPALDQANGEAPSNQSPAAPTSPTKRDCNGVDGLFNVELCE